MKISLAKAWWHEGGGSIGKAPHTPSLGSRRRLVVSFTPRSIYPREIIPLPTEQEAGCALRAGLDGFRKEKMSCSSHNIYKMHSKWDYWHRTFILLVFVKEMNICTYLLGRLPHSDSLKYYMIARKPKISEPALIASVKPFMTTEQPDKDTTLN